MRDTPNSAELLAWYDKNAREMPWRVAPDASMNGERADPYFVWLSEVMLQQTTVAAVREYFIKFTTLWPTVSDLANADDADVMAAWAGLGYYARARNLLKCARVVVDERDGIFPSTRAELEKLPGIGPYTSAAIAAIAFGQSEVVVDGNVERVMARLFAHEVPMPESKPTLRDFAAKLTPKERAGDYAQAVMDLGATLCSPRNPSCEICPWRANCIGYAKGIAAELPKKSPKKPKPIRYGTVFLAQRDDGAWLLEKRPDRGLLGGMMGWPGNNWAEDPNPASPPIDAHWTPLNGEVRHTFTHFHLRLSVQIAQTDATSTPERGVFVDQKSFSANDLPTVMRKAFELVQGRLNQN
ncbi:A/G-specific adenine glycosylase [Falsihalocynthiibacter sp. SS001]|uniref:A/G-specific adenine glycosylase n=1 Tax=Falsihalocynthiibacter sp. SS001 TaxID=3349698 RepID=UPI0036D3B708